MLNIALGEVIFGGVGAGLYGMLIFAILAVFIAGLMVGRTPEYLGKKIGPNEMKMAMLAVLALEAGILVIAGISAVVPAGRLGGAQRGPHGLTEILYAATSAVGQQRLGVRRAHGLRPSTRSRCRIGMLVGRFLFIVPVLAIAGSMAAEEDRAALLRHVPDRRDRCSSACSSA